MYEEQLERLEQIQLRTTQNVEKTVESLEQNTLEDHFLQNPVAGTVSKTRTE